MKANSVPVASVVRRFNNLLLSADGRDKFYRILQYVSRFLGAALPKTSQYAAAFQSLSTAMAETRRVLRLFRFLSDGLRIVDSVPKLFVPAASSGSDGGSGGGDGKGGKRRVKLDMPLLISLIGAFCNGMYMLIESIMILEKARFIKLNAAAWNRLGNFCWFASVISGLLVEAIKPLKAKSVRQIVKLIFDAPIAYNLSFPAGFSLKLTGALGTVSSWCMFLDVWDKA
eukprot:ANDGO_02252.mRNA.1 hypothetical protein